MNDIPTLDVWVKTLPAWKSFLFQQMYAKPFLWKAALVWFGYERLKRSAL